MESNIDLQSSTHSLQNLAQNQTQTNPPSGDPSSISATSNTLDFDAGAQRKRRNAELCAISKTFGPIPNIPIFTQWGKRKDCSDAAVHRSVLAGICGNARDGTYSVAVSNRYKDNEDWGDVIIYTGAGGRERWTNTSPPKRLRCGPQTLDQSWDASPNKALQVSFLSGNPVRVIRSYQSTSQYAPLGGYRYDGLYKVAACWTTKGRSGKNICRCRLERLPHQPPIPLRPIVVSTSKKRRERLVSSFPSGPSTSTNPYDMLDGTDVDMSPNQPDVCPGQFAGEFEGLQNPPQQRAMSEVSTQTDFDMGKLNPDVKHPQKLAPQPVVSPKPSTLPRTRYRWDPKNNTLVKIPALDRIAESNDTVGGDEENNRMEGDDATLVPSEDGHVNLPVDEHMETEFFFNLGNADESHPSGSSSVVN